MLRKGMRLIFGEMKAVLLTKFLDYKKQSSIHYNNGTDYEPFRSQFLGLFEQILSLNISAHGSKFRKNDSVPNERYQELCFDIDISLFPTTSFSG